jgi:hypothetical protein
MSDVHKVIIQTRAPRGKHPGTVIEGYYRVAEDHVVLCDELGKPSGTRRQLDPGGDARLIACRMLRKRQGASGPANFNRPIQYPRGF